MTIFQRPSSIRKASSTPLAAMSGVTSLNLPVGEYPTFLSVLAISSAYFQFFESTTMLRRTPMTPELPKPITDYVNANAQLDVDGMLRPFAADAVGGTPSSGPGSKKK